MSDNDSYILQLKDFDSNMSRWWKGLHSDIDLCDLTLVCDENQIKLHKIVGSSCSLVLRKIIKKNPHHHPLIYLRGIKYAQLVNLIDFMYKGEIKIPRDEIDELLTLAKDLQVIGLFENKEEEIEDIDVEDANEICKSISPKINKVVDITQNDSAVPLLKTTSEENVGHINEDDVKRTSMDNNLVSPMSKGTKRAIIESGENANDTNGRKRNKVEHTFQKKSVNEKVSDEQEDIIDLGYQEENYNDDTCNEMAGGKQNFDYKEDLHRSGKDIPNELPIDNANTKSMERNISEFKQINFDCVLCNTSFSKPSSLSVHITSVHEGLNLSCDKCQYTSTQRESLICHVKTTHYKNSSVKTDADYNVIDTNKEVEVLDVNIVDANKNSSCPSLETDIVTQNITKKRTKKENLGVKDKETAKDSNVKIVSEQNKLKLSSKNEDGYEQQDKTELVLNYGYQSRNPSDIPLNNGTESLKLNVNYTQDLYENINNILNGFPAQCDESEKVEEMYVKSLQNKFNCGQCYMKFSEPSDLSTHIKSIHEGPSFSCNVCLYTATQSEKMIDHIKTVHNINISLEDDIFSNDIFKISSLENEDSSNRQKSETAVEESSGGFNLPIGYEGPIVEPSKKNGAVNEEKDGTITDKNREGPEKNEEFNDKQYQNISENELLAYNTNTEQEEVCLNEPLKNNQKCGLCEKEFTQPINLSRHIRSIHEGLNFSCDKCQYTATQSGSLIRHIKSVHDKIRYSCNSCDYSATQKPILNKHIKMKH